MPDLDFEVVGAEVLPFAAAPTMVFKLAVENAVEGEQIHAITLRTQIRIAVTKRRYDPDAQDRLLEVFGEPHRWGETLRSLLWTHTNVTVPRFTGSVVAEMPVVCTYDFDVVGAKYFHALEDGEVPLEFLFSGSVFYAGEGGRFQVVQVPWEKEAEYRLPIRTWREMMDLYFPNSTWLRLQRETFDRLYAYRSRNALATWEDTLESLLQANERGAER